MNEGGQRRLLADNRRSTKRPGELGAPYFAPLETAWTAGEDLRMFGGGALAECAAPRRIERT